MRFYPFWVTQFKNIIFSLRQPAECRFCIYALYLLEWGFFNDEDEGVGYSHFCYKNDEKSFLDFITWNGSPEKTKAVAKYSTRFFYILSRFDKQSIDDIFRIIYLEKYERGADVDDQSLLNILNEMAHVNEYTGENDEEIGFHWCEDRETKKMIVDSLIKLRNHFDEETLTIYFKSLL